MGDGQIGERMDKKMGMWMDMDKWMRGRMYGGITSWVGSLVDG